MASTTTTTAPEPAPGAFKLTAVEDDGTRIVAEPEGMVKVRELGDQVAKVVHTLNSKVSRVLHKQEQEFLSAYRGHMYSVQRELQSWKDKADAARLRQERDQRMQRLTEESAWFRKEAVRLNKFTTALKREVGILKKRLEAMEEDNSWLDRQLKASKKDNKLLRAELELRMMEDPQEEEGEGRDREGSGAAGSEPFPPRPPTGASPRVRGLSGDSASATHTTSDDEPVSSIVAAVSSAAGGPGVAEALPRRARSSEKDEGWAADDATLPPVSGRRTASQIATMQGRVAKLKAKLQRTQARNRALEQSAESTARGSRELELALAQCIHEVRLESERKRGLAAGRRGAGAGAPFTTAVGGVAGLDASDKRLVVKRLLEDDLVLGALQRTIFGDGGVDPLDVGAVRGDSGAAAVPAAASLPPQSPLRPMMRSRDRKTAKTRIGSGMGMGLAVTGEGGWEGVPGVD